MSIIQGDTDESRRAGLRKRGITLLIAMSTVAMSVDKTWTFAVNVAFDRNALTTIALISRSTLEVIGACTTTGTATARKFATRQTDVIPVYSGADVTRRASSFRIGYVIAGWEAVSTNALKVTK